MFSVLLRAYAIVRVRAQVEECELWTNPTIDCRTAALVLGRPDSESSSPVGLPVFTHIYNAVTYINNRETLYSIVAPFAVVELVDCMVLYCGRCAGGSSSACMDLYALHASPSPP